MSFLTHNLDSGTLSGRDTHTSLKIKTEPTIEPITLKQAKLHLRVDITDDDLLINDIITAARDYVERAMRRQFIKATWELTLDRFTSLIELTRSPLIAVNTIKYLDVDGVEITLAATEFTVDKSSEPARVVEADGKTWPTTQNEINAVVINYDAGYGAAASAVPKTVLRPVYLYIHDLYENRGAQSEINIRPNKTIDRLISIYALPRAVV